MTKLEEVARALAPIAWAALGASDTLAHKNRRTASLKHAKAAMTAMKYRDGWDEDAAIKAAAGERLDVVGFICAYDKYIDEMLK